MTDSRVQRPRSSSPPAGQRPKRQKIAAPETAAASQKPPAAPETTATSQKPPAAPETTATSPDASAASKQKAQPPFTHEELISIVYYNFQYYPAAGLPVDPAIEALGSLVKYQEKMEEQTKQRKLINTLLTELNQAPDFQKILEIMNKWFPENINTHSPEKILETLSQKINSWAPDLAQQVHEARKRIAQIPRAEAASQWVEQ